MKKPLSLFLCLSLLLSLSVFAVEPDGEDATLPSFTDIEKHWAREAIEKYVAMGVINGYKDGTFRPDNLVTRAEAAKILTLTFGLEQPEEIRYTDLKGTEWDIYTDLTGKEWHYSYDLCAAPYLSLNVEVDWNHNVPLLQPYADNYWPKNIMQAVTTAGQFLPEAHIARYQLADTLVELLAVQEGLDIEAESKSVDSAESLFPDDSWPSSFPPFRGPTENQLRLTNRCAVAYSQGIMTGDDQGCFRPYDPVTRAELLTVIDRMLERKGTTGETTTPEVSSESVQDILDLLSRMWGWGGYVLQFEGKTVTSYPVNDRTRRDRFTDPGFFLWSRAEKGDRPSAESATLVLSDPNRYQTMTFTQGSDIVYSQWDNEPEVYYRARPVGEKGQDIFSFMRDWYEDDKALADAPEPDFGPNFPTFMYGTSQIVQNELCYAYLGSLSGLPSGGSTYYITVIYKDGKTAQWQYARGREIIKGVEVKSPRHSSIAFGDEPNILLAYGEDGAKLAELDLEAQEVLWRYEHPRSEIINSEPLSHVTIPNDGIFHDSPAGLELLAGETVRFETSLTPGDVSVWVKIRLSDGSQEVTALLPPGEEVILTAPVDGDYKFQFMAPTDGPEITGGVVYIRW